MSILTHVCIQATLIFMTYASGATISCTFDSGLCGWHGVEGSSFQWKNHSGPSPDRTSGPLNDHTCKNFNGQYLYISGDETESKDDEAILQSNNITLASSSVLEFWYLMNGIGVGKLRLIQFSSQGHQIELWSMSGKKGRKWMKASVKLKSGNFQLRFMASVNLPYGSDLAIDDIRLKSEQYDEDLSYCARTTTTTTTTSTTTTTQAPTTNKQTTQPTVVNAPKCNRTKTDENSLTGSCDFETNMCGFKVSTDNLQLSWIRTKDKIGYGEKQIPSDHSGHGYYMRYDKGGGFMFSNPQYKVRLESPLINDTDVCLSFWYIMPYEQYSNLRVFVKDMEGKLTQIWVQEHFTEKQTNKWHLATMSIQENQPFQIIFSSHYNRGLSRVGIDDINILGSLLSNTNGIEISCTFDHGLCGWHGIDDSSFQWKNHSGPSPDRTSGPLNDHTCNNFNGQYLFVSGDDSESKDDEAILESNTVTLTSPSVLDFWYLINGVGTGNLRLIQFSHQDGQLVLWSVSGKKGWKWMKASVKLQPGSFTLRFIATADLPYGSDLAIDDIRLLSEKVDVDTSYCERTTTPTFTTTTTSTTITPITTLKHTTHKPAIANVSSCSRTEADSKLLPGSCDFETDMCGFEVSSDNNRLAWLRTNIKVGYGDKQIPGGYSGNGYYMRYDKGGGFMFSNPQYKVRLESPLINDTDVCLSFWYIMPYEKYSNLRVFVKDIEGNLTQIWTREHFTERQTNKWHLATMSIQENQPFQIVFSTRYDHGLARVGIDHVRILGGTLANTKFTTILPTSPMINLNSTNTSSLIITSTTTQSSDLNLTSPMKMSRTTTTLPDISTTLGISLINITSHSLSTHAPTLIVSKKPKPINNTKNVNSQSSKSKSLSKVVGASVGSLMAVLFLAIIGYFIYKSIQAKHKKRKAAAALSKGMSQNGNDELSVLNGGLTNIYDEHSDGKVNGNLHNGFMTTRIVNNEYISNGTAINEMNSNVSTFTGHMSNGTVTYEKGLNVTSLNGQIPNGHFRSRSIEGEQSEQVVTHL